ncbi:MAG: tRNA (adenosine(37)-N6)-threonylcarbamoyltransferase complex transferase subunit TsaD [Candidatus Dojkabacteria bacterium]|nr:tRNA (adenosine(37)-N6)-threonylcarbamoyltransferase complex transferase subunit TsaD [Candidatus Dojkabacteria bacterium]
MTRPKTKDKQQTTKILGIETTCDETSAAVVQDGRIVLSDIIASQAELHKKYGGIVPEVASRKHLEILPAVVEEALKSANTKINEISAIAVAKEPGLPPALSVGYAYASGLASGNNLPLVEVNHLEAHITGIWLVRKGGIVKEIQYPFICLSVSGGHTSLTLITDKENFRIIGNTVDDAAGEAFDKTARMLGLGYPGGPIIDKLAREGDETKYYFPRPMIKDESYNFSFSGLKTAVQRLVAELEKQNEQHRNNSSLHAELKNNWTADVAASFQEAVVDVLIEKTIRAAEDLGVNTITMAGGVSANTRLRDKMGRACLDMGYELFYPEIEFCLDNAAMIAGRGYELYKK